MLPRAHALVLAPALAAAACSTAPMPEPVEVIIEASARTSCPEGERWSGGRCVPEPSPAPPKEGGSICRPGMALVEGGTLEGGDKPKGTVRSFCMDVTEVTVGAYEACVTHGRCDRERLVGSDAECNYGKAGRRDHPINCVSWEQADRFCRGAEGRLPTVEEWLWAAQGGRKRLKRPWGDAPAKDQLCWSATSPAHGTCPVGKFRSGRTPQGIDDLYGGVWEWATPKKRRGVANVNRGGCWSSNDEADISREGAGNFTPDFERNDVVGFRCVADPSAGAGE